MLIFRLAHDLSRFGAGENVVNGSAIDPSEFSFAKQYWNGILGWIILLACILLVVWGFVVARLVVAAVEPTKWLCCGIGCCCDFNKFGRSCWCCGSSPRSYATALWDENSLLARELEDYEHFTHQCRGPRWYLTGMAILLLLCTVGTLVNADNARASLSVVALEVDAIQANSSAFALEAEFAASDCQYLQAAWWGLKNDAARYNASSAVTRPLVEYSSTVASLCDDADVSSAALSHLDSRRWPRDIQRADDTLDKDISVVYGVVCAGALLWVGSSFLWWRHGSLVFRVLLVGSAAATFALIGAFAVLFAGGVVAADVCAAPVQSFATVVAHEAPHNTGHVLQASWKAIAACPEEEGGGGDSGSGDWASNGTIAFVADRMYTVTTKVLLPALEEVRTQLSPDTWEMEILRSDWNATMEFATLTENSVSRLHPLVQCSTFQPSTRNAMRFACDELGPSLWRITGCAFSAVLVLLAMLFVALHPCRLHESKRMQFREGRVGYARHRLHELGPLASVQWQARWETEALLGPHRPASVAPVTENTTRRETGREGARPRREEGSRQDRSQSGDEYIPPDLINPTGPRYETIAEQRPASESDSASDSASDSSSAEEEDGDAGTRQDDGVAGLPGTSFNHPWVDATAAHIPLGTTPRPSAPAEPVRQSSEGPSVRSMYDLMADWRRTASTTTGAATAPLNLNPAAGPGDDGRDAPLVPSPYRQYSRGYSLNRNESAGATAPLPDDDGDRDDSARMPL